jgi:hypothetical protein
LQCVAFPLNVLKYLIVNMVWFLDLLIITFIRWRLLECQIIPLNVLKPFALEVIKKRKIKKVVIIMIIIKPLRPISANG